VLLSELIRDDLVKVGMEATGKWEAIEELVDVLIDAHEIRLTDRAKVVEALFARERSLSTGLEHGLAVPHAAVNCVDDIIAAFGTAKDGIPFESLDGKPARVIVLLIIPKGSFQRHVRTLAGIARLSSDPQLRDRLIHAAAEEDVMGVIYEHDEEADEDE